MPAWKGGRNLQANGFTGLVWGCEFRVWGYAFRVLGLGFKGLLRSLRVWGFRA